MLIWYWSTSDGGWREKIKSELSSFTTGHEKSIIEAFDSSSQAYALARLSLTGSRLAGLKVSLVLLTITTRNSPRESLVRARGDM